MSLNWRQKILIQTGLYKHLARLAFTVIIFAVVFFAFGYLKEINIFPFN